MSNTPGQDLRGDAALLKAIETGSPVATNEKQAGELCDTNTRWGVWGQPKDGSQGAWRCAMQDHAEKVAFDTMVEAGAVRKWWHEYDGDVFEYTVRPYPAPTPPATAEGERYTTTPDYGTADVRRDNVPIATDLPGRAAQVIVDELNTLAAENARLRDALEHIARYWNRLDDPVATLDACEYITKFARTALGGGAK